MATEEVKIFFKVEGLDGYITDLDDLKSALGGVTAETKQATTATEQLSKQSIDSAEKFERRIQTLEGGVKVLAGSAEFAAGAIGLLGDENSEWFKEVEGNVLNIVALAQGAIDFSEGLTILSKNTKLATIAQRAFNVVAKANPYVLLATALLAAGAALFILSRRTNEQTKADIEAEKAARKLREERVKLNLANTADIKRREQLTGITEENSKKELQSIIDREKYNLQVARDFQKRATDTISAQTLIANSVREGSDLYEDAQLRISAATMMYDRLDVAIKANNETINTATSRLNQLNSAKSEEVTLTEEQTKAIEAQEKARLATEAAATLALQQAKETRESILDEQGQLEDELYEASLTARQREERAVEDAYYARLSLANENEELELQALAQFEADKLALQAGFDAEDLLAEKELTDSKIALAKEEADARQEIADKAFSVLGDLMFLFQKNGEKDAKKNFENSKKAGIAQAVVNTALAVGGALTAGGNPLKLATGAQFVEAGIAAVAGAAQVAAIARTRFGSGGGGSPPPSLGGGGGATLNYQVGNQSAGANVTGQFSGGAGGTGGVSQTYVLAGDVTSQQQAEAQIQNLARL